MTSEHLMLTSYFGERQRAGGAFFADTQLEAFGRHKIVASVLLRGISGFGLKHHLRTDGSLTLSEDLPLVSIAVDSRTKVERVVEELEAPGHRGLVTVDAAWLLPRDGHPALPSGFRDDVKLTIFLGRHERVYRAPAFAAVCDLLHRRGLDAAIVLPGVDGTRLGQRIRARLIGRNDGVAMVIVAVGSPGRTARVLPELGGLLHQPMIAVERVQLCKRNGRLVAHPRLLGPLTLDGEPSWRKLTVYSSADSLFGGEPVHRALVRRLRGSQARGATVLSGMWGFHDGRPPYGDNLWALARRAPTCTILLDTADRIGQCFDLVNEITAGDGVVTLERVPALVASTGAPASHPAFGRYLLDTAVTRVLPRVSRKSIGRWVEARSAS